MPKEISRRTFLKYGIASACTLAGAGEFSPAFGGDGQYLATVLDIRKCIGCEACVEACRESNAAKFPEPVRPFPKMYPVDRAKPEDWSGKRDINDRLTPYNWLFIQRLTISTDGKETEINIPRRCMHCENPPCVKLCPWGAAEQFPNGISRIDKDLCLGGAKCKTVCPWSVPQRQTGAGLYLKLLPSFAGNGLMTKCDRCYDKIAKGGLPACIEACPQNVQSIGFREEMLGKAHAIAKEINGHVYGDKENGGTNTFYVSPVPFETLNKAIPKKEGNPHFKPVKDSMEDGNKLITAMAIAPVAGIAAAAGKYYKFIRKNDESGKDASR
jgi:formate dehydrogenase iron-sulfur subunit